MSLRIDNVYYYYYYCHQYYFAHIIRLHVIHIDGHESKPAISILAIVDKS